METHSFDKNIAQITNVNCAIILQNIYYWCEKNKANDMHKHNDKYWTYNSMKAFEELFPYLTERQIRYALTTLEKEGLILIDNFNETCTRTLWYAVTDKAIEIMSGKSIQPEVEEDVLTENDCQKEEDLTGVSSNNSEEVTKLSIRNDKIVNTYLQNCQIGLTNLSEHTNNKPHITTTNNIEKEIYKEKEDTTDSLDPVVSVFNYWNSKDLIKCERLKDSLRNIIRSTLKSFTLEEIKLYIDRYEEVLNSREYFFQHRWSLKSFICQPNAMSDFKDNGEKWYNYTFWKKYGGNNKDSFGNHRQYTREQIDSFITDLDNCEV